MPSPRRPAAKKAAPAAAPHVAANPSATGDYFLFATAARGSNGDDTIRFGRYAFTGATVGGDVWVYSAEANKQGIVSKQKFPGGPGSGPIRLPRYLQQVRVTGTWSETIDSSQTHTLALNLSSGAEVWHHTPSSKVASTRYDLASISGGAGFVEGYAFRTNRYSLAAPPAKAYWYPSYPGRWCGTVHGVWQCGPSTFNQSVFKPTSSKIWYYKVFETSSQMWVFYALLFGEAAFANLIFYQSGGHDFNKDGIPNDLGHTTVRWAIYNDQTRHVEAVLGAECSYDKSGRSIVGVGYAQHTT